MSHVPSRPFADLIVVGGAIVGLSCALALHRRGIRCRVVDRQDVATAGWQAASWASAGMIAPLGEVSEPGPFLDVCRRSRDLWIRWAEDLERDDAQGSVDLDYDRSGAILVDEKPGSGRLARFESYARRLGEPVERLDPDRIRRLIPDASPDLDFGLRLGGEHRIDNRRVCTALRRHLERAGVPIECGVTVEAVERHGTGVEVRGTEADGRSWRRSAGAVLVAAGAWSAGIDGLGEIPIRPLRGQMLRLGGVDWPFRGCVRGEHFYAVRRQGPNGGDLLIGATEDDADFAAHVTADGLAQLTGWLRVVFPTLADHPVLESWAGLRPTTPDGMPLLGPVDDGIWLAAGHHRNGILLAPWTAETMASWIADDAPPAEAALLAPDRLASAPV